MTTTEPRTEETRGLERPSAPATIAPTRPPASTSPNRRRQTYPAPGTVSGLMFAMVPISAIEAIWLRHMQPGLMGYSLRQVNGVLDRTTDVLPIYFSRVLAPSAVWDLQHALRIPESSALLVFMSIMFWLMNAFWLHIGKTYCGSATIGIILGMSLVTMAGWMLHSDCWLATPWDWPVLAGTSFFAYLAFTDGRLLWLGLLFVAMVLTRENALYIPVWIGLSSIGQSDRRLTLDIPRAALAIVLFLAGASYIQFARELHVTNPIKSLHASQWDMLWYSGRHMFDPAWNGRIYTAFGLVALLIGMRGAWPVLPQNRWATAATMLFIVVSVFRFAEIVDYRVWFDVLPFGIMALAALLRRSNGYCTPSIWSAPNDIYGTR